MAKPLRIALTKGRLEKDTVGLLERLGYDCTAVREKGRRLILPIPDGNMEVVLAKANDANHLCRNTVSAIWVLSEKIRSLKCRQVLRTWLTWVGRCKVRPGVQKGNRLLQRFRCQVHCNKVSECSTALF